MKKTRKILYVIALVIIFLLLGTVKSKARDLNLNSLEFNVQINSDGSMNITENWNIYISSTNTLYKSFKTDSSKYSEITNVTVKELKNGQNINFVKDQKWSYHVDKNHYYGTKNEDGDFEIGWGVGLDNSSATRAYQISYTVKDAITKYQDYAELYWQFVGENFEIDANNITGTIYLPSNVLNKEDIKVWGHTEDLNGTIYATDTNKIEFEINKFRNGRYVEVRTLFPSELIINSNKTRDTQILQTAINEETKWANEANERREKIAKRKETVNRIFTIGFIITNIIGIMVFIVLIKTIIKYHKKLKETPKLEPEEKFEYYRDIPDENVTPAQAGYIYYFKNGGLEFNISKVFSATMLDLCMKKYLEFESIADKKEQIKINLKEKDKNNLSKDEQIVYEILQDVAKNDTKSFTMKEFEKYSSKNASKLSKRFIKITEEAGKIEESYGNVDKKLISESENWIGKGICYIFLAIISILIMQLVIIPSIISAIYSFIIASRYNRLTQKGINEKEKLDGLKRYMEDFSKIDDKTVPELVLWEKYLVYATTFGIADKVLKQLKIVYPQITDSDYMMSHGYTYMYLMYSNNFNNSFLTALDSSMKTSYYNINYSSGSGSGGGFSGGGGFGRRPEAAEAEDKIL